MTSEETVLAASITFNPTRLQLYRTLENIRVCSGVSAIFDNSDLTWKNQMIRGSSDFNGV